MNAILSALLKKHKLVGTPLQQRVLPEDSKETILHTLAQEKFFRHLGECEKQGILLGYDELVECTEVGDLAKREAVTALCAKIEKRLHSVFQDELDSFFLGKLDNRLYLHIKYTKPLEKLRLGPTVSSTERTPEERRFRELWEPDIEHRRFEDGRIRICASFMQHPCQALRYILLSRIFALQVAEGVLKTKQVLGKARVLTPALSVEQAQDMYSRHNQPGADEFIRQTLNRIKDSCPTPILSCLVTGSLARTTRGLGTQQAQVYLKLEKTHRWPIEQPELFANAVTAMNGILGKALKHRRIEVEGISPSNTLHVSFGGEPTEIILSIESEIAGNPQKYALMNFRVEYDKWFQELARQNSIFPKVCVLVKQLLYSHGLYPYHLGDKIVEILCLRTARHCQTLEGGFKAATSTQYSYGYQLDIRPGKLKMRTAPGGTVLVVHSAGAFSCALPAKPVFDRMNAVFQSVTARIESAPGIDLNYVLTPVFRSLFIPDVAGAAFLLSRIPLKGYTEIDHYQTHLGGCSEAADAPACFEVLQEQGCTPYFCGNDKLLVQIPDKAQQALFIGTAVFLTGMRYLKVTQDTPAA